MRMIRTSFKATSDLELVRDIDPASLVALWALIAMLIESFSVMPCRIVRDLWKDAI